MPPFGVLCLNQFAQCLLIQINNQLLCVCSTFDTVSCRHQRSATGKQHQPDGDVVTDAERQGLFRNQLKSLIKWTAQEAEQLADYATGVSASGTD
jgi:hypothetical protein